MHLFRLIAALLLLVVLGSGHGHAGFTGNGTPEAGNDHDPGRQGKPAPATAGGSARPAVAKKQHRDDELLVKFREGTPEETKKNLHRKHGAEKLKEFRSLRLHLVRLRKGMAVEEGVRLYRADPDVEYAEPNLLYEALVTPNDPQYGQLWGMARISAPAAWNSTTGNGAVVVAVIDTGIDFGHPDLAGNVWTNPAELAGNGLDDDADGYVDDLHGIDSSLGSGNPMDDHGHGTHVAGTIGAVGNNGIGVAGLNWNVRMMACKFLTASGSGATSDAVECLQYVKSLKDRGVNIVATNNSWGCSGSGCYSQALYDAINAQRDILFIAAAANNAADNDRTPSYPAAYDLPNLIAVAATGASDVRAGFSNYGRRSVHLAAPGDAVLSTLPDTNNWGISGGYGTLSGTSMATPHVTGLAALLKSQDANRNWVALRNLLLAGGDSLTALREVTITGRRINAFTSLNCAGRPVFSILKFPGAPVAGVPQTLSALSIDCAAPAGPVAVALSGGGTIPLLDDGVAPDLVAGDGVFTGTWVPAGTEVQVLTFSSPAGSEAVASPSIKIVGQTVTTPAEASISGDGIFTPLNVFFNMQNLTSGGLPGFTWTVSAGSLPPGLAINPNTGEISGTPSGAGAFTFTVQVADGLGMKDFRGWSITISEGLRAGWPKELARKAGSGWLTPSYSPVFADLDGDGKDEIVAVEGSTLYLLNETGVYNKKVLPGRLAAPAVVDLDHDGRKEIVVTASFNTTTPVYAFHADLTPVAGFPAGGYNNYTFVMGSPVAADLANDGSTQIVVTGYPNSPAYPDYFRELIQVVDSQGRSVAGWPGILGTAPVPLPYDSTVAVGDVDGDGANEMVFASVDGKVHIFRNNGSEAAQWPIAATVASSWGPVLADLNGDGVVDIVLGYLTGNGSYVLNVCHKDGLSLPGWPLALSRPIVTPPVVADLNGDGLPEIIVGTDEWVANVGEVDSLSAFRADGTAVPGWPVTLPQGNWISYNGTPVVADVNGDGQSDVLISSYTPSGACSGACSTYDSALRAYASDGQPVSGYPKNIVAGVEQHSTPAVGDLDDDGRADIALKGEDGTLYVWEAAAPSAGRGAAWPMYLHDPQHTGLFALPAATIGGTPASPTNATGASLTVGGTGVVAYVYRVDAGSYSPETPVAQPIALGPLAEGTHTVAVTGKDGSANWQTTPTTATWAVDLTPPAATVSTPAVSAASVILRVGGPDVVAYKHRLDAGDYSAETPVMTGISLGYLGDGPHTLEVIGRDSAGNWQTTPTTASWVVDTWPVSVPAAGDFRAIMEAYAALASDNILQVKSLDLVENLLFNRAVGITLRGGYDPATGVASGSTTLYGSLEISAGTVNVENLAIMAPM
jgi:subtilisin family serine protease